METEVKERLVGAVILVLLAVLVVPALLSGPRQAAPVEPALSPELRSVEIDLGGPRETPSVEIVPLDEPVHAAQPDALPEAPTGVPQADEPAQAQAPAPVAAPPPASPATVQAPAPPGQGWAVQVAALSNRDAAATRVAELKRRGYPAFLLEYRTGGRVLYRVRVGPESARERAAALASRLKAEGIEGNVVSHP